MVKQVLGLLADHQTLLLLHSIIILIPVTRTTRTVTTIHNAIVNICIA